MRSPFPSVTSSRGGAGPSAPTPQTAFAPDMVGSLIGWYDASETSTLAIVGNECEHIGNKIAGGLPLRANGINGTARPIYDPSNRIAGGRPALLWDATERGLGVWHPQSGQHVDATVGHLFVVTAYADGEDETFDGYTPIISVAAGSTICQGQPSAAYIRANTDLKTASVNGGTRSGTILPLPLSVLHFDAADAGLSSFDICHFGTSSSSSLSKSWKGPLCELLAYSPDTPLTANDIAAIEAYLMVKWGIADIEDVGSDFDNPQPIAPTPPPWPLSAPNLQQMHGAMAHSGSSTDVTGVTFDGGLPMVSAGSGAPIAIGANGLTFDAGKYLTYAPSPAVPFDGLSIYALISRADTGGQRFEPISMNGPGLELCVINDSYGAFSSQIASGGRAMGATQGARVTGQKFVVGIHYDLHKRLNNCHHSLWWNGTLIGGSDVTGLPAPTQWIVGKGLRGVMERGLVFTRRAGETHDLLPPGVTPQWICDQLAGAQ